MDANEAEFGQEVCSNCGWDKGAEIPISEVTFTSCGDALCPECGHICDYFDYRDLEVN